MQIYTHTHKQYVYYFFKVSSQYISLFKKILSIFMYFSLFFYIYRYLQVLMIIGGTCIVSMAKKAKKEGDASSLTGVIFVALSLICDGLTGGLQKRLKQQAYEMGLKIKPYEMMFWTNWFMMLSSLLIAAGKQELIPGYLFISNNPELLIKIAQFAACSAIGQSFIFFTLANFEPLVCSTVNNFLYFFLYMLLFEYVCKTYAPPPSLCLYMFNL